MVLVSDKNVLNPTFLSVHSDIQICRYAGGRVNDQIVLFVLHLLYILSSVSATVNLDCNQQKLASVHMFQ